MGLRYPDETLSKLHPKFVLRLVFVPTDPYTTNRVFLK